MFRLDHIAVFKQFEGEGIGFKSLTFQTFCEAELCLGCGRSEGIVEFSVCWKCINRFKNMAILSNSDGYCSFHWVISHASFFVCRNNFFYSVMMDTNFSFCECQIVKGDHTTSIVSLRLKNSSVLIFQLETELTIFKCTTCKSFGEVEFCLNRGDNVVVKDLIIIAYFISTFSTVFNFSLQITRSILSNRDSHGHFHVIVVNICICAFFFSDSVCISTYFIKC